MGTSTQHVQISCFRYGHVWGLWQIHIQISCLRYGHAWRLWPIHVQISCFRYGYALGLWPIHLQIPCFRYMATEAFDPTHVHSMKYYDYGSDVPFNFDLIFVNEDTDGYAIHSIVDGWLCDLPEGKWPNWVVRGLANLSKEKLADFEISHKK